MVDEFALRQEAKDLIHLYAELDAEKYAQQRQPDVRTMKPAPGPRPPAPDHIISLDEELTSRLFRKVRECANYIQPTLILAHHGPRLCSFLAFNAQAVSELDVAPELMEELKDQARQIKRIVAPDTPATVAKRLEPYHRAEVILQRLAREGHTHTRDGLRKLAERSQTTSQPISTEQYGGRTTYRYTEVLNYLTR